MKLNHEDVKEKLSEYIRAGRMPDEVKAHLQTCKECSEEAALLEAMCNMPAPEPGGLFFETLPQRVRESLKEKKKSFIVRLAPVFALLTLTVIAGYIYNVIKPFGNVEEVLTFSDPFSPQIYDFSQLTEDDIPSIADAVEENEEELYISEETPFLREFASLSSEEIEALYKALNSQQKNGGV